MKEKFLALFFAIFTTAVVFANQNYSIDEAIKRNLVTLKISGVANKNVAEGHSTHYGACISVNIKNNTSQTFSVSFESGRLLDCHDSSVQTMLLTKSSKILLQPNKTSQNRLFAMCSQKNKAAPSAENKFRVGKMAKQSLLGLAQLIEKKNYQNSSAQNAVWAITDNKPIDNMKNGNAMEKELYGYVSKVKKLESNVIATQTTKINFSFNSSEASSITIKVFNSDGQIVKTLLKTTQVSVGENNFVYWLDDAEFAKGKYKVVLFQNGIARMEEEFSF